MGTEKIVSVDGLLIGEQGNDAEVGGLCGIVFLVFGLVDSRDKERGGGERFLTIDFAVTAGARNTISDGVRTEPNAAGIAQRLDTVIIGNQVAELDDFRDAAEMVDQASSAAKGLAGEGVNKKFGLVEIWIWGFPERLGYDGLDGGEVLADRGRG